MYLLDKFCGYRSYGNRNFNSYIISFMIRLEKAELTASVRHIKRFSKSEIPIYNSEVPDTDNRKRNKRRRRRTETIAKRYLFHANAINKSVFLVFISFINSCVSFIWSEKLTQTLGKSRYIEISYILHLELYTYILY